MESKEQHLMRQSLILIMFFLFLSGCANKTTTITTIYNDWKPRLAAKKTWQVHGKLAFISPQERQSANLNWQQRENSNDLVLTSFIGTRILLLKQTQKGAELEFNGEQYSDSNAAELLRRLTGLSLPVNNADNWLKGTISDESLYVDNLNRAKHVLWFDSNGIKWQIDYASYIQKEGYWLPTKLTLKNQKIKIKIQLYDWQLN